MTKLYKYLNQKILLESKEDLVLEKSTKYAEETAKNFLKNPEDNGILKNFAKKINLNPEKIEKISNYAKEKIVDVTSGGMKATNSLFDKIFNALNAGLHLGTHAAILLFPPTWMFLIISYLVVDEYKFKNLMEKYKSLVKKLIRSGVEGGGKSGKRYAIGSALALVVFITLLLKIYWGLKDAKGVSNKIIAGFEAFGKLFWLMLFLMLISVFLSLKFYYELSNEKKLPSSFDNDWYWEKGW